MIHLAIALVHNKNPQQNAAQVEAIKSLLTEVTEGPFTNPDTGEQWTTIHHEIVGLNFPHQVKVRQIVPYGVTPPSNMYEINSGGVTRYDEGQETDKTGDHPEFFNWNTKRGMDNGAEVVIHLDDYSKFSVLDLEVYLNSLLDPEDKIEFVDHASFKAISIKAVLDVGIPVESNGQIRHKILDTTKNKNQGLIDFKERVERKGFING